jgi:hypothetical protein
MAGWGRRLRKAGKALLVAGILLAAGACVLLAYMLGLFRPEDLESKARQTVARARATAVGTTRPTSPAVVNSPSCAADCRSQLRAIERAKRALHARGGFATGEASWAAVAGEVGSKPKCPCGGSYSLGTFQQLPSCSVGANGTADARDDHVLDRY